MVNLKTLGTLFREHHEISIDVKPSVKSEQNLGWNCSEKCSLSLPEVTRTVRLRDQITISQCFFQIKLVKIAKTPRPPSAILTEKT